MNSRELVLKTLEFKNTENRVPQQLWALPWADIHHHDELEKINHDFPSDFGGADTTYSAQSPVENGDMHEPGNSTDAWGCKFYNLQRGVIGEVKEPIVKDMDWEDVSNIHIPEEWLSFSIEEVNQSCANSDKFIISGCCPRPFEQLQFIRGTENLYIDLMDPPKKMLEFFEIMHDFYCRLMTKWAQTDVDALNFMDDWGAQNSLLISPSKWDEYFKPMYQDYLDIAKKYNKKTFMHSDGYTMEIIPRLIDMGLDALNTQIFCMGVEQLKQFKGKITFWGEIDRQNLLPYGSIEEIDRAVQQVYDNLWSDGGCIAQCEFGAGANPNNVYRVFEKWQQISTSKSK